MNWKKYKVSFYSPSEPWRTCSMFDYYVIEALNAKDAIKISRQQYERELLSAIRNLPPIKEVKFVAIKRDY